MSDGIIKTSELPKIIPPLPTGDTKDLKVWQDYWKQHDKQIRQDEREKVNKIFDHTRALCDAIIEKLDCQSKLGFNALIIKRDIEPLRAGKDGEA